MFIKYDPSVFPLEQQTELNKILAGLYERIEQASLDARTALHNSHVTSEDLESIAYHGSVEDKVKQLSENVAEVENSLKSLNSAFAGLEANYRDNYDYFSGKVQELTEGLSKKTENLWREIEAHKITIKALNSRMDLLRRDFHYAQTERTTQEFSEGWRELCAAMIAWVEAKKEYTQMGEWGFKYAQRVDELDKAIRKYFIFPG